MKNYRIHNETIEESKISTLIEPILEDSGFLLVQLKKNDYEQALQIFIEKVNGQLTISDCSKTTKEILQILENDKLMPENYRVEVSSPGIDRVLVRAKDFEDNIGNEIKIELKEKTANRKNIKGEISSFLGDSLTLKLKKNEKNFDDEITVSLMNISKAKLVFSEKLLKKNDL
ncbi:MAG: ribosome maturation factor RimP [Hyphomicrobiales bacterium]|jgi:ribosome maturation factor RimP